MAVPNGPWRPLMERDVDGAGVVRAVRLGYPEVDRYLEFVAARARPNTLLAVGFDLKVFFTVIGKDPVEVTTADVYSFIAAQRTPRRGPRVVRLEDREPGLSARTIKRRLSSVSGLFGYLIARGDAGVAANPVPCGLATRRPGVRRDRRGGALIRTPRTLPRVVSPEDVDAFFGALRTHRDRAMILVMLLGGLRRCEVLGLRCEDVDPGLRRVFIADGKGGAQRYVPIAARFFAELGAYLEQERPAEAATERLFVALKRPQRGAALTAEGLDEIVEKACRRAGVRKLTCHQLRHTCFTRLRETGMALEAIQALAGHRCIESTRIYLKIANRTVANEYFSVSEKVEALYNQAKQLPAEAEGTQMRKLRAEMHRRMLGNGYCARPVELDCHFESICESCTYFVTTIEFRPTLQQQRDDAHAKGQIGPVKVFDGLLHRLDADAS